MEQVFNKICIIINHVNCKSHEIQYVAYSSWYLVSTKSKISQTSKLQKFLVTEETFLFSLNYVQNFEHSHFCSVEALFLAPQTAELSLIKQEPPLLYVSP
jgi:hypothetical protein